MTAPTSHEEAHVVSVGKDHRRRTFFCYVNEAGTRWRFAEIDGEAFDGPVFTPLDHEFQLQQMVEQWWAEQS